MKEPLVSCRSRSPRGSSGARAAPPLVALAVVPAALWWIYLRIHLGAFPFGQGSERLAAPFAGWKRACSTRRRSRGTRQSTRRRLGEAAVPLIIVVGLAILIAGVYALRLRTAVDPAFLAIAPLYACITPNGVQYPKDLIRELALVLTLLPFVLATRPTPAEPASARRCPRAPPPSRRRPGS